MLDRVRYGVPVRHPDQRLQNQHVERALNQFARSRRDASLA